jgi:RNA polymerase sigma-70 factor (ECF subfamily)
MAAEGREELERGIRRTCEQGDIAGAAAIAIRGYGGEIFGFLLAFHRSEQDASDVFSVFTERVWRGLGKFSWECSFRTWAYTIARNASRTHRNAVRRRAAAQIPLPEGSALSVIAEAVRSETLSYLKTAKKSRIARLRESLPAEDRMLLSLRVDRELAWTDLARVLSDDDEPDEEELKKVAARLRKRFQVIKEKLFEMGRREGVIEGDKYRR